MRRVMHLVQSGMPYKNAMRQAQKEFKRNPKGPKPLRSNRIHYPLIVGDKVEVLGGRDKGKQGVITTIIKEKNQVLVEGVNVYVKHVDTETLSVHHEGPKDVRWHERAIPYNNVAVIDPVDAKPTKIVWAEVQDEKDPTRVVKRRISVRTKALIPYPIKFETNPVTDTSKEEALKLTYVKPTYPNEQTQQIWNEKMGALITKTNDKLLDEEVKDLPKKYRSFVKMRLQQDRTNADELINKNKNQLNNLKMIDFSKLVTDHYKVKEKQA